MNVHQKGNLWLIIGLLSFLSVLNIETGYAQTPKNTSSVRVELDPPAPSIQETQPEYSGGFGKMNAYLRNIHYPEQAKQAGITGRVFVTFVIDTTGKLQDIKVLKGIGYGCDEEALRAVRQMPAWKPATRDGKAVSVKFNLPILFPPAK